MCQQGAVDVPTFGVALEGLGAQVGDAVALEVLRPGEGLPTALLRTGEASVVVVLPGEERGVARGGITCHRVIVARMSDLKKIKIQPKIIFFFTFCVAAALTCW